jgi:hypothetical protein
VAVTEDPPATEPGLKTSNVGVFAVTVSDAVLVTPLAAAETDTVVLDETVFVTRVKLPVVDPAGTVTDAGIEFTAELPLVTVKVTAMSDAAAAARVTVPVLLPPPMIEVGEKLNPVGVLAVTVSDAVLVTPFAAADTCTVVLVETLAVPSMKVAVVEPAGTVTDAGIELTAEFPLVTVRVTGMSAAAAATRVTVPVLLAPAITEVGENFSVLGVLAVTVSDAVFVVPLATAETETVVFVETFAVTSGNVAVEEPASTVTDAGIELTPEFPLVTVSVTEMFETAAAVRVTVPVLVAPAMTDVGENFRELSRFGVAVKVFVTVVPLSAAEILTVVEMVTALVTTLKVAVELPAGTVTEAGMDATAEAPLTTVRGTLVSEMVGAPRVSVPVVVKPPTSDVGLNVSFVGISCVSVSTAVMFDPPNDAVRFAVVLVDTPLVVTVAGALVAPAGTVTVGGTTASELLLERLATAPPEGATPTRYTVPIEFAPPTTEVGVSLKL